MKYYDLKQNWRRIRPHLVKVSDVLVRDFNKYTFGRWEQPFLPGMLPRQFESCDWDWQHRGRRPAFWQYTKHAACHWLVNFNLELAMAAVAHRQWRIITSPAHSTVWDGEITLFDFNFQAMDISPDICFTSANDQELTPGEHIPVYFATHYSVEMARLMSHAEKRAAAQKAAEAAGGANRAR